MRVKEEVRFDTLNVDLSFASSIDTTVRAQYKSRLAKAVRRYNRGYSKYVAVVDKQSEGPTLTIRVDSIYIATRGEQMSAFALSLIGIGVPSLMIASGTPFPLIFWFNAYNNAYVVEGLSDDIRGYAIPAESDAEYRSPAGWFRSNNGKMRSSARGFENRVLKNLRLVGKSIKTSSRYYLTE